MAKEPRRSQRVDASIPVRLDNNAAGVTRDISPNGVYFVIDEKLESGQTIRFTMEFDDPAAEAMAACPIRGDGRRHQSALHGVPSGR